LQYRYLAEFIVGRQRALLLRDNQDGRILMGLFSRVLARPLIPRVSSPLHPPRFQVREARGSKNGSYFNAFAFTNRGRHHHLLGRHIGLRNVHQAAEGKRSFASDIGVPDIS
jgi:hypothetical protein